MGKEHVGLEYVECEDAEWELEYVGLMGEVRDVWTQGMRTREGKY